MSHQSGTLIDVLTTDGMRFVSPDGSKVFFINVSNTGEIQTSAVNTNPSYAPSPLSWVTAVPSSTGTAYIDRQVIFDGNIGSSPTPTITASTGGTPSNISIVNSNTLEFDWDTTGATAGVSNLIFTVYSTSGLVFKRSNLNVTLTSPFTPNIAGANIGWWDFSNPSNTTATVLDLSTQGVNAIAGTGNSIVTAGRNGRNYYHTVASSSGTTVGGLNAVGWNGFGTSGAPSTEFSIVLVFRNPSSSPNGSWIYFGAFRADIGKDSGKTFCTGLGNYIDASLPSINQVQLMVVNVRFVTTSNNNLDYYLDSNMTTPYFTLTNNNLVSPDTTRVEGNNLWFNGFTGSGFRIAGDLFDIAIYNRRLTLQERLDMYTYMHNKWIIGA